MIRIPQIGRIFFGRIFCNHIQRHTIGLSALSAWRLPDGRQSGSGKGRSHPTNEVWRIHQRHFTMFLSRIITSRYIAVKWLRRVYWLTSHEHRRFSRLAPTILLLRIDDSFRKHRRLFFKSPWMLGEVNQLHFQKESFPAFTGLFFSSSTESADNLTEVILHQQTPATRSSCFLLTKRSYRTYWTLVICRAVPRYVLALLKDGHQWDGVSSLTGILQERKR